MLKKLAMATVALSALALNAPAAMAHPPTVDCRLHSVQQDEVTGQTFQGVLVGAVAHEDTAVVTIRCRVTVNGVTAALTPFGVGQGVATTQGDVTFAADDTDDIHVCADFTAHGGSGTVCAPFSTTDIPPAVVGDTVDGVLAQVAPVVDPPTCEQLKLLAGDHPGGVFINDQGDVFVNGERARDCPPYDDGGGGGGNPPPPRVRSAVVGYIRIVRDGSAAQPTTTWTAIGALSDPNQWHCTGGGGSTSYTVTCTPLVLPGVDVRYTCDVLHADIAATTVGASGQTSMDCDSDGIPEAQTGQKFGPAGYDFVWATSTTAVTRFTCTLDLAVPTVTAGCGDPGLVGVE